ncbi:MAG: acyl-CoA dehydrogenase, partial [Mycolicibacterium aromaticivorans]|nr:acyl-CoA dehydrogenase [Mycolicibacterium aromaticivorans]
MDFSLPEHLTTLLAEIDAFIEADIKPLEREHIQYFDQRREFARTDVEGLHNDLQDESSIVGNFPQVIMMDRFGTDDQKSEWIEAMLTGTRSMAFGLTEPDHGSDATWLETRAVRDGDDWVINGNKRWNTGVHRATHDLVFARTSGEAGQARGITAFLVPCDANGF